MPVQRAFIRSPGRRAAARPQWDLNAERLGGPEVQYQRVSLDLLNRQFARLRALENLVYISGGASGRDCRGRDLSQRRALRLRPPGSSDENPEHDFLAANSTINFLCTRNDGLGATRRASGRWSSRDSSAAWMRGICTSARKSVAPIAFAAPRTTSIDSHVQSSFVPRKAIREALGSMSRIASSRLTSNSGVIRSHQPRDIAARPSQA